MKVLEEMVWSALSRLFSGHVSAGRDLRVASYGGTLLGLNAEADRDIVSVWSRGAIAGSFWAGHDIVRVMGYDAINSAAMTAVNRIGGIDCWRTLGGNISAGQPADGQVVARRMNTRRTNIADRSCAHVDRFYQRRRAGLRCRAGRR